MNPSNLERDEIGIIKSGVIFEKPRAAYECVSPVTHAGIFQAQHVHLSDEVARLTQLVAGLEVDNKLLRDANIALMDREERLVARNAELEAAIRQVVAGNELREAIAALPDH